MTKFFNKTALALTLAFFVLAGRRKLSQRPFLLTEKSVFVKVYIQK